MPKRYPTVEEKREVARGKLDRIVEVMGPDVRVEFLPTNMAAGPCASCLSAARQTYRPAEAPLAPLDGCPHPDQCIGTHRIVPMDLEEDREPTKPIRKRVVRHRVQKAPEKETERSGLANFLIGLFGG